MNYTSLLSDITDEEGNISNLLDKAFENFLNANKSINQYKLKVKAYKSIDELDNVEYLKLKGYEVKEIIYYKEPAIAIFIFIKK